MKRSMKRMLALTLTALMLVSYMPWASSFAQDSGDQSSQGSSSESYQQDGAESEEGSVSEDPLTVDEESSEDVIGSGEGSEVSEEAGSADEEKENEADAEDAEDGEDLTDAENADLSDASSVEDILNSMTTRQKICQCLMMDFRKWEDSDGTVQDMTVLTDDAADMISDYQFGAVILFAQNIKDTEDTLALTKAMQAAATKDGGLPMMIATDQEGGLVYRLGSGTALPGNMAIGATGDTDNAKISGEIIGRELSSLGINTTLAPVVDVNSNAANPVIGVRSFSDDADMVGSYGQALLDGLDEYNVIGCAKHFPGHGDTSTDSHYGLPVVNKDYDDLKTNELKPFQAAIDSGAEMIMTAHILYPDIDSSTIYSEKMGQEESRPATMSHKILTEILRDDMGFDGVVVTDAMDMAGVSNNFSREQATYEALMAGADMICMPVEDTNKEALTEKLESVITYIKDKAENGDDSQAVMARLDEAVLRILKLKQSRGILDYSESDHSSEKALAEVGSSENRSLEREISAKAVTVVRNDNNTLPYQTTKTTKVLMLCPYNNERAQMVMGLNRAKAAGLVPGSVEVDVYRFSASDKGISDALKEKLDWADLVIANSELYDTEDMSYAYFTSYVVRDVTEYCKAAGGKRTVVMSVSIPYDTQLYPDADAVIAVYGCKGSDMELTQDLLDGKVTSYDKACGPNIVAGIEVIFGVYGASGTLPVNVPKFKIADGEDIGSYDTSKTVYERGWGITYDKLKPSVANGKITLSKTSFVYTGKTLKPSVTVTDCLGNKLKEGVDYTLKNDGRTKVGTGSVTVTGKGKYTGKLTASYKVIPKKAYIKTAKRGWRKVRVFMSTAASKKGGTGYQVAYKVKGSSTWKYKNSSSRTITIRKLKRGKRYIVKARAYSTVNGVKYYGSWSKAKTSGKVW